MNKYFFTTLAIMMAGITPAGLGNAADDNMSGNKPFNSKLPVGKNNHRLASPDRADNQESVAAKMNSNSFAINRAVDGQFTFKGDVGYLYNFANDWNVGGTSLKGTGSSAVGYGASLGYTHRSGFGLSADYLGFNSKGLAGNNNYDASFHALAFTPSYRIALDTNKNWGLKLGLGIGFSLSDVTWGKTTGSANGFSLFGNNSAGHNANNQTNRAAGKLAGGAIYSHRDGAPFKASICGDVMVDTIWDIDGGAFNNTCTLNGVSVATFSDGFVVSKWFVHDDMARLGTASNPKGGSFISGPVWRQILIAADGDWSALRDLGVNQETARLAFLRLVGGYDGVSSNSGFAITINTQLNHTAESLGINAKDVARLASRNVSFGNQVYIPPVVDAPVTTTANTAKAKGDVGVILVPQVALEYDNGYFHGDINVRYIHALKNVTYNGTGNAAGTTYNLAAGPAGIFVGLGLGVNF